MAEREGFEPSIQVTPYDDLANRCLQPLGHLSAATGGKGTREGCLRSSRFARMAESIAEIGGRVEALRAAAVGQTCSTPKRRVRLERLRMTTGDTENH